MTKPVAHWVELFNEAGIPCGPVNRIDQVLADPQVQHSQIAKSVTHPRLGDITLIGQPIDIVGVDSSLRNATPELGEHTREVLVEAGFSAAEIDELYADAVVK